MPAIPTPLKGEALVKFNIEADVTPEEARRLIGLPDLTEVHQVYLDRMKDVMARGITPDMIEPMIRSWMPGGGAGIDTIRELVGGFANAAAKNKAKKD